METCLLQANQPHNMTIATCGEAILTIIPQTYLANNQLQYLHIIIQHSLDTLTGSWQRRCEATDGWAVSLPSYSSSEAHLIMASFMRYCTVNIFTLSGYIGISLSIRVTARPSAAALCMKEKYRQCATRYHIQQYNSYYIGQHLCLSIADTTNHKLVYFDATIDQVKLQLIQNSSQAQL